MFRLLWLLVILSCSLAQASLQRDALLTAKALQTITPDAGLRPGVITSPAGTFTYTFAGGGTRKTALTMPGGSASWEYDDAGWLSETAFKVGQTARDFISYDRDISGLITNLHRLNGVSAQFGYDPLGQLTSARSFEAGGALRKNENLGYLYDAVGNLAFRTNHTLLQAFTSGSFNQLLTATRSGSLTVAGSFGGQLSSLYVNTNRAELYSDATFATAQGLTLANGYNQFVTVGTNAGALVLSTVTTNWLPVTVGFNYDLNGNLLSDGQKSYEYDRANQLTSVTLPGEWRTEYSYDGLSRRRISREYTWRGSWVLASEVRYVYDRMLVLQERHSQLSTLNPQLTVTYTRGLNLSGSVQGAGGIGGLLARTDHSTFNPQPSTTYYHSDGGGNITSLTDSSGAVVARYLYDPFGRLLGRWGSMAEVNRYQFSSKETDRLTGLSYYGYRFYDPSLQRWLNQDPLGEAGGINLYGFVGNSPVNRVDPLGLAYLYVSEPDAFSGFVTDGIPGPLPYLKSEGWEQDRWFDYPIGILNNTLATAGNAAYQLTEVAGYIGGTISEAFGAPREFGERFGSSAAIVLQGEFAFRGKPCPAAEKGLYRPKLRKGTKEAIDAKTSRAEDGRFLDIDGTPTSDPVCGHKFGHENWREIERAEAQGLSQKQFNDRMNNPDLYQIEDRLKNANHSREMPR